MAKKEEKIPTTNATEIEALIDRFKGSQLKEGDAELIERLLRTLVMLLDLLDRKNYSIKRLKALLFGRRTEKQQSRGRRDKEKSAVSEDGEEKSKSTQSSAEGESGSLVEGKESSDSGEKAARAGHGRRAASEYSGAKAVSCRHDKLKVGDPCPECGGLLYDRKEPKILLQFVGRPLIEVTKYVREVLRCVICLKQYVAPLPEGVKEERFDPSADATFVLMRYGGGLPWHRQAALQSMCGVPISESVMWERCEEVANASARIYRRLLQLGANGELVHTDDTKMVILSCLKEDEEKKEKGEKKSRATQTSGMVIKSGGHWIAFYFSARRHAGENLEELLKLRQAGLDPPIEMADALNANWDHETDVIEAKCMVHGRRGVWDVKDLDPEACGVVLDAISKVYKHEAETAGMNKEERLKYYQEKSGPEMEVMKEWIERQFAERVVEPNSSVGNALQYWLNHWDGLTAFLRVAGAPLDNNAVERALKQFILMRKNSLFYKTEHGAAVGDILSSLIQTCRLNNVNPWDYLVTILRRRKDAHRDPDRFLPWNYPREETAVAIAA
jgi:transposase